MLNECALLLSSDTPLLARNTVLSLFNVFLLTKQAALSGVGIVLPAVIVFLVSDKADLFAVPVYLSGGDTCLLANHPVLPVDVEFLLVGKAS